MASRGLPAELSAVPSDAYLLGRAIDVAERASWSPAARIPLDRLAGIGTATLHDQIKAFFAACADKLQPTDPASARRLANASAHWMRHTHGSHAVAAGMDIKVVQQNLGHASLTTTTRYTTSEARRRATETAKLWGTPAPASTEPLKE
jgi:integrase